MGLKSQTVVVPSDWGARDAGKHFLITEMPATKAEKWGMRAILMLRGSGERVPDNAVGLGMVGVAILGINVFLRGEMKFEQIEPLLDEMMECVKIIRDPRHPDVATPLVTESDIEEVQTRLWLRSEVLRLHTGFSPADALSKLLDTIRAPASNLPNT
jgi:hypothetical protein